MALFCLIGLPLALFINAAAQTPAPSGQDPKPGPSNYRLSGPYTHKNLTVFLVHGKDQTTKTFLTLQEALAQKKVRVYETKDVNELEIRNLSNQDIYVQAGDIVRGGEQDRMISIDFIVPPRSGRMPIEAFCVESDRWERRGNEAPSTFSSSENYASSRDLQLAAKSEQSQAAVWENVSRIQSNLSANTLMDVTKNASPSSLELSVRNRAVRRTTAAYIRTLSGILRNKRDVIGYVFAINGEVYSGDVYASRALFAKLWPKLIRATSVEALSELKKDLEFKPVSGKAVQAFLAESEQPEAETKEVTARVKVVTKEDAKNAFYETQDRAIKDGWVHRNYIRKQ
jgi:hypothetical protein